jgi:hypothetical protein
VAAENAENIKMQLAITMYREKRIQSSIQQDAALAVNGS